MTPLSIERVQNSYHRSVFRIQIEQPVIESIHNDHLKKLLDKKDFNPEFQREMIIIEDMFLFVNPSL